MYSWWLLDWYFLSYLIPWPGPHATFSIHKLDVPGPIDIQSSPVPILEFKMVTAVDNWTWMPSVLGLFPSAETLTPCNLTFWQPLMTIWNIWLFNDANPVIAMFFELENSSDCTIKRFKTLRIDCVFNYSQSCKIIMSCMHTVAPLGQLPLPEFLQDHSPAPWPSRVPPDRVTPLTCSKISQFSALPRTP